jgi:glycosyltransferase involved in cell wall biosynthesis
MAGKPIDWGARMDLPAQSRNSDTPPPKVTFVVPCFKLAHLLGECVDSILRQTYPDFEVLIMDDASPDETEAVARSYSDPRVRYVRNEHNLGNILNYNKGIALARGQYVWLISADDCLKQPYVLSRYVAVMEANPNVGFVFSPAIALHGHQEGQVIEWTRFSHGDAIVSGREFLRVLMDGNCVAAPAGMVRKVCYDSVSVFPPELFHTGDWYLWCVFALHFDVAYIAEPMVFYRTHGENMSLALRRRDNRVVRDNLRLARWRLRAKALEAGATQVVREFDTVFGRKYANEIAQRIYHGDTAGPTVADFEFELQEYIHDSRGRKRLRAAMFAGLGDQAFQAARFDDAKFDYSVSLTEVRLQPTLWVKQALISLGPAGVAVRKLLAALRRHWSSP